MTCTACYNANAPKYSIRGNQSERDENGKIKPWGLNKSTAHMFHETRMMDHNDGLPSGMGTIEDELARLGPYFRLCGCNTTT